MLVYWCSEGVQRHSACKMIEKQGKNMIKDILKIK